jgi:hypothetical protein
MKKSPESEEDIAAKLKADLAAINNKKAEACAEEIKAVLAKHGMGMQPRLSLINGNQIQVELSITVI